MGTSRWSFSPLKVSERKLGIVSKMKFIILLSIFILGSAYRIDQGSNVAKCSVGGPEYWCKNKETAKKCQALSYCEEHVWKETKVDDAVCEECQEFVHILHEKTSDKAFQTKIIATMSAKMCNNLPSTYQSACT